MRLRNAGRFWWSVSPYAAMGLAMGLLALVVRAWVTR